MAGHAVQWAPALAMLALGLALGALVLWRWTALRGGAVRVDVPPALPLAEVRDLLVRRDSLYDQLRELEESPRRTPGQKAAERQALELEAARVLMELDDVMATAPAPVPSSATPAPAALAQGFFAERPGLRGFLWGVGSMAAVAALLYLATSASRPRSQGEEVTGGLPGAGAPSGAPESPRRPASAAEQALEARLLANPDDIDARLDLARTHLAAHDLMAVYNDTQEVLARRPDHPRALGYQALVRVEMGQTEVALQMLKKALALAPEMVELHVHLIIVYARMGRLAEAEGTYRAALLAFPADAEGLRALMGEIRQAAKAPPADTPPVEHPPATTMASTGAASGIAGVIELDPAAAASVPAGTALFLSARAAGVTQGPPVAVKRLVTGSFPLSFTLGAADSMMGQALPPRLRVEARVDSDGNPLTRAPGDPVARLDDIAVGTSDLRLVLRRE